MKRLKLLCLCLLVVSLLGMMNEAYAAEKIIKLVELEGIDYPYINSTVLDTSVTVSGDVKSIVSDVSWSTNKNGQYRVTVTVRPYINYAYDKDTVATINGNKAEVNINKDKNLEVSYLFEKDENVTLSTSSSTLRHVIYVYASENGSISPNIIRALHNENVTVQILPNKGYQVKDVYVDGESVGAVTEYTFKKVKTTHKISASFEPQSSLNNEDTPLKDYLTNLVINWCNLVNSSLS